MFYTIYKITNKINGKIYIGKHQTEDLNDSYMGSGKLIQKAIFNHGIEHFQKEILFQFDNEEEMNLKEKELVTEEFIKKDTNYNLCPGGHGGWGYINSNGLRTKGHSREMHDKISRSLSGRTFDHMSFNMKKSHSEGKIKYDTFTGKTHSDETRRIMSSKARERLKDPKNNSQYGTRWIHSLAEKKSMKIKKDDPLPKGWAEGRKIKFV